MRPHRCSPQASVSPQRAPHCTRSAGVAHGTLTLVCMPAHCFSTRVPQGGHGPSWQVCQLGWAWPHARRFEQGWLQGGRVVPQRTGGCTTVAPQSHTRGWRDTCAHGLHGPAWHMSSHVCSPQASMRVQVRTHMCPGPWPSGFGTSPPGTCTYGSAPAATAALCCALASACSAVTRRMPRRRLPDRMATPNCRESCRAWPTPAALPAAAAEISSAAATMAASRCWQQVRMHTCRVQLKNILHTWPHAMCWSSAVRMAGLPSAASRARWRGSWMPASLVFAAQVRDLCTAPHAQCAASGVAQGGHAPSWHRELQVCPHGSMRPHTAPQHSCGSRHDVRLYVRGSTSTCSDEPACQRVSS